MTPSLRAAGASRAGVPYALLLIALCAGCDGDDADQAFAQLPCDILEESCQDAVYRATAEVAQIRAQGRPPVREIDVDALEDELRERMTPDDPEAEQSWSTALQLLGLLPQGQSAQDAVLDNAVSSIAAYYDAEQKKVTVVDRGTGGEPGRDLFVLAHELAHALRDAETDLIAFREQHVSSTDSFAASSSLTEGEAMVIGAAVVARTAQGPGYSVDWSKLASSVLDGALSSVERAPAPLVATVEQLPYAFGTRRLALAWDADGRAAIDPFFERPLLTLLSWSEGAAARAAPDPLQCFPTAPPPGYVGSDSDSLGLAALIALPVALGTDSARAALNAGTSWRDDRLVIFRPEGDTAGPERAVAWRLRFASAGDADDFASSIGCCLPSNMKRAESGSERELLYLAASARDTLDSWSDASACGTAEDVPVAPSPMTRMAGQ